MFNRAFGYSIFHSFCETFMLCVAFYFGFLWADKSDLFTYIFYIGNGTGQLVRLARGVVAFPPENVGNLLLFSPKMWEICCFLFLKNKEDLLFFLLKVLSFYFPSGPRS